MTNLIKIKRNYLPKDIVCEIMSHISDVRDILNYINISKIFQQYGSLCITQLHADQVQGISSNILRLLPKLEYIDHKIIVTIDNINNIELVKNLENAYFLIDDINLIPLLLKSLHKLKHHNHYFKIGLRTPEKLISILIQNSKSIIIPQDGVNQIEEMIDEFSSISQIQLDRRRTLYKMPLRQFVNRGDFGLETPTQLPSPYNRPLSEYIVDKLDYCTRDVLIDLIYIYMIYNKLINSSFEFIFDDRLNFYFQKQIGEYNLDEINKRTYTNLDIYELLNMNIIKLLTVDELSEYKFPNIVPISEFDQIRNTIYNTRNIYKRLVRQGWFNYYDIHGNIQNMEL